ncbi:GNAT family N-acetyltransferase [Pseudolysinimonas sp.]|uniref:GNAT family N-acetyltransferase n=1 Tax=Pseudolysinimonas sp. TaxID=2680009 RepID=UPI003F7D2BDB
MTDPVVLREDDPRTTDLLAHGWRVVARSWGAHAVVDGALVERLRALLSASTAAIDELGRQHDDAIAALDEITRGDYPQSAATPHPAIHRAAIASLRVRGVRITGATEGDRVVAMTAMRRLGDAAETEFTAVAPDRRRRGLAVAVKAAAMLAAIDDGAVRLGTGGSALNEASIRMNERCGYALDERWVTLER